MTVTSRTCPNRCGRCSPATGEATTHRAPGTSGGSGFVENAHANGPNIYAHEQYHLQHATANTSYTVTLHIYGPDTTCTAGPPVDLDSAVLRTNTAGNASGSRVFTPAEAAGLPKGVPLGIVWTMTAGAGDGYTSTCQTVVLD